LAYPGSSRTACAYGEIQQFGGERAESHPRRAIVSIPAGSQHVFANRYLSKMTACEPSPFWVGKGPAHGQFAVIVNILRLRVFHLFKPIGGAGAPVAQEAKTLGKSPN
jgi:hypothetical protein